MNLIKKTVLSILTILLISGCGGDDNSPIPESRKTTNTPDNFQNPGQLLGPNAVNLRTAGNYVILAKSAITSVVASTITGDLGISPAAASDMGGFSLSADPSNVFSTSAQVTGKIYASDYAVPTPSNLTTAVSDMLTAYNDAASRPIPDSTELGSGDISGLTLQPGLYKWSSGLLINTDVTLNGGPNDVIILQIAGGITMASNVNIVLTGGMQAKNIFYAVGDVVTIGTGAHFEGIVLASTMIAVKTGASVNGALLAQTAVTLDKATITKQ